MDRIRINVRGVREDAWERFRKIKSEEQISLGRLVTEALDAYAYDYFEDSDESETD